MGSTLTGSTVSSTYNSLLKTSDNAAVNGSLKSVSDGIGNDSALQISTADVNVNGGFSVASNKLTVAAATGNVAIAGNVAVNTNKFNVTATSGNTAIAGTLNVTGATVISNTLNATGSITTSNQLFTTNGVRQTSSEGSNLFNGDVTFSGATTFNTSPIFSQSVNFGANQTTTGTATFNGAAVMNGNTTLGNTNTDTLTVNATSTFATASTFNASASFNNTLIANGNVTIGTDSDDTLTINSAFVPATVTVASDDFLLITDTSDSGRIKKVVPVTSIKSLDWNPMGDAAYSAYNRFIQFFNSVPAENWAYKYFPGYFPTYFSLAKCDFVPTKIGMSVIRTDTSGYTDRDWIISIQYATTPSIADSGWTDIGPSFDIKNGGYYYVQSNVSIPGTPSEVYFRIKAYNSKTGAVDNVNISNLLVRFQNY